MHRAQVIDRLGGPSEGVQVVISPTKCPVSHACPTQVAFGSEGHRGRYTTVCLSALSWTAMSSPFALDDMCDERCVSEGHFGRSPRSRIGCDLETTFQYETKLVHATCRLPDHRSMINGINQSIVFFFHSDAASPTPDRIHLAGPLPI